MYQTIPIVPDTTEYRPIADAGIVLSLFIGLAIRKIWQTMCITINGPSMILTFDLGGHAPVADAGRHPPSVYQV